ncbi:MAG: hypothetical protein WCC59_17745 [Terriglobales bacterium]
MRTSLIVTLLLAEAALGQMRNMAVNDTNVLKNAGKIAVFINLGQPAAARYRPDFDRAKKQISKKLAESKLELVETPEDADIVLVVNEFNSANGVAIGSASTYGQTTAGVMQSMICLADEVRVFKGGRRPQPEDAPIWSASEACGWSWPLNRAMDKLAKAMKK